MMIETERLILRPWKMSDARELYHEAQNPNVGPSAGWPAHKSILNSQQILQDILMNDDTYAITLKESQKIIGSVSYFVPRVSEVEVSKDSYEVGYWIGENYWGHGYMPEALIHLMEWIQTHKEITELWATFYEGNHQSQRVLEKAGFQFNHIEKNKPMTMLKDKRDKYYMRWVNPKCNNNSTKIIS